MHNWTAILKKFITQSQKSDLKTAQYPKDWADLKMRVSFGMGAPARVPWIAFITPEMAVSRGFYPVYLYYKDSGIIILAYGISDTEEFTSSWPAEIMNSSQTITAYLNRTVPRYGESFVFKSYNVAINNDKVNLTHPETNSKLTNTEIESDLNTILDYYKKINSITTSNPITSNWSQGLFYMEKQLEDFLILNWDQTEFGKKYDLIIEEGELKSQQYHTEIGPIDILVKDKKTKDFVVIELKKNQTSDDTIGQITRYMGWIKQHKGNQNVRGIIVAGQFDKKLEYAMKMVPNLEVFLYEVNFKLKQFTQ